MRPVPCDALAGVLCLVLWSPLAVARPAAEQVEVRDVYARAVPTEIPNSAAFMVLANASPVDHALVAAHGRVAMLVELHTHDMAGGVARMRPVERIELPAGETVRLEPGGYHVMLLGLDHPLVPGEKVSLTLEFEDGSRTRVEAPVRRVGAGLRRR